MKEELVTQAAEQQSLMETLASFMNDGGAFMWIILGAWCLGVAIAVERVWKLRQYDIDGPTLMSVIKKHVLNNQVIEAIQYCTHSSAALSKVLRSGLKRTNQSKEMIVDAMDASMLEHLPKVDKRLNYLALIANISTLVGLLGTIQGLIQSFAAVATADPASKSKLLALGISKAMNTTALGLMAAISIMVIHTILTNKADKIVTETQEYSLKLADLLGSKRSLSDSTNKDVA